MGKIRELLAGYIYRIIIRFLGRELHGTPGRSLGIEAETNNQPATFGRLSSGSFTGGSEDSGAYQFGLTRVAAQFKLSKNVSGKGTGMLSTTQGKY